MGLESGTYVNDLVVTNPLATDPKSQGDDHLRLIKTTLKNTFPGFAGAVMVSGTDGGSANTYTVTPSTALSSYTTDLVVIFTPSATNTGSSTLNVSSLGAKTLKDVNGNNLVANDLVQGSYYVAVYDGTNFRLLSVTKNYIDQLSFSSALPDQTGNDGLFLTTSGGSASWGGAGFSNVQVFTSSGTFTTPKSGKFKVTIIGGGGGGSGYNGVGDGGGAGGTAVKWYSGVAASTSCTVTIGAAGTGQTSGGTAGTSGGASSFSGSGITTLTANGGASGDSGRTGGTATGGDINQSGQSGSKGIVGDSSLFYGGLGGASSMGGGGSIAPVNSDGVDAVAYGAGGSGASYYPSTNRNGGNGKAGICIVEY